MAKLEAMGKKDLDYCCILKYVLAKRSFKELPSDSEASTIGGEWVLLLVLDEFEVFVLSELNNGSKIFSPKAYRPMILKKRHETAKKSDFMFMRVRLTYTWQMVANISSPED